VPIHAFKLVTCYRKPAWSGLALWPVLSLHWGLLIASQAYFNTQCACSALGCWYPGSVLVIFGGPPAGAGAGRAPAGPASVGPVRACRTRPAGPAARRA
jgi:hypothetical protein